MTPQAPTVAPPLHTIILQWGRGGVCVKERYFEFSPRSSLLTSTLSVGTVDQQLFHFTSS